MRTTRRTARLFWAGLALALQRAAWSIESGPGCAAQSAARVPLLVELYTSEGCSSCPPADRWLSGLKTRPEVMALSFHVDYWDRLGWRDRFSNAAHSQRQWQLLRTSGARYPYTPQMVIDGRDQPRWSSAPLPMQRPQATVQATLQRHGDAYHAEVRPLPGAPPHIAGFWAMTEDGHASAIKSGENRDANLAHDFVVREYEPIAPWDARDATTLRLRYSPPRPADAAHPRQLNLVLVDADSGQVLQALRLGC
jgi:hypothetical protein